MNLNFGLDALNFSLAGAREGFGPFLGVYLQHQGFDPARTGFVMSLAGLAGIAASAPLGALIDRVTIKLAALIFAVACIAIGAILLVLSKQLCLVAAGQVFIGVADSSLAPLVAAITLGMVGPERYPDRVARNEAFNHAGNAVSAALSAALGYIWGLGYVAAAIGVMAIATGGVVLTVDPRSINHEVARGGVAGDESTWRTLWGNKALLLVAATAFAFQAANGAMLPFIAQALTTQGADPSLTTGAMTVVAQVSMVGAAVLVPRLSRYVDHDMVFGVALLAVVLRAGLASASMNYASIAAVQVLEGLSMGLAGVAIPALVARVMSDSGHTTAGLGSVMLAYGAGAALSPALAGLVAQYFGFQASFLALGLVAALGLAGWIVGIRAQAGQHQPESWNERSPNRAEP